MKTVTLHRALNRAIEYGHHTQAMFGWRAIEPRPGPALGRWLGEVGGRPSMAPLRALAAQFNLPSV